MSFYVSNGDLAEPDIRRVYAAIKRGFNARRIPRKAKKRLLWEWVYWRGPGAVFLSPQAQAGGR